MIYFLLLVVSVLCKVDPDSLTISGLSSGAYFATQYQIAHSSTLRGAAIFAGGPYYCAENNLNNALLRCMNNLSPIPLNNLMTYISRQATLGNIDPVDNLHGHAVYILSGTMDITVKPQVVQSLESLYRNLGITNIETVYNLVAAHTFPTQDFGNSCTLSFTPYISRCAYDGAGAALQKLYGPLQPPTTPVLSNLHRFAQVEFTPNNVNPTSLSMYSDGYVYIPTGCQSSSSSFNSSKADCRLHVSLHGCQQTIPQIQMAWVQNAGYNRWAESNNIIILYPQAASSIFPISNPNGCWDWWGYLDANYANKLGRQIITIKNMVDHFLNY